MPWEQFEKKELSGRLQLIAGYLANRLYGQHVVDLNCGTAPLLHWLPNTAEWGWYYGNDTDEDFICRARMKGQPCTTFECVPDDEVMDRFPEHSIDPDILLCLGYGARHHELESQTLDETFKNIIKVYEPEIVVLEHWIEIDVQNLFDFMKWHDYVTDYMWHLQPTNPAIEYGSREILIWKRKDV